MLADDQTLLFSSRRLADRGLKAGFK